MLESACASGQTRATESLGGPRVRGASLGTDPELPGALRVLRSAETGRDSRPPAGRAEIPLRVEAPRREGAVTGESP